jgi:hypothetical protein
VETESRKKKAEGDDAESVVAVERLVDEDGGRWRDGGRGGWLFMNTGDDVAGDRAKEWATTKRMHCSRRDVGLCIASWSPWSPPALVLVEDVELNLRKSPRDGDLR